MRSKFLAALLMTWVAAQCLPQPRSIKSSDLVFCTPHPVLRTTLSLRERVSHTHHRKASVMDEPSARVPVSVDSWRSKKK